MQQQALVAQPRGNRHSLVVGFVLGCALLVSALCLVFTHYSYISVAKLRSDTPAQSRHHGQSQKRHRRPDHPLASAAMPTIYLVLKLSPNESLLTRKTPKITKVQNHTSGTHLPIIVSDINGVIKQNDHITASPIAGVGMKRPPTFASLASPRRHEDHQRNKKRLHPPRRSKYSVQLGQVPALINVSYFFKEPDKSIIPSSIQNVANSTGRPPSQYRTDHLSAAQFFSSLSSSSL